MKKFLLGTTALISLSAASAAMAGGSHAPAAAAPANTGGLTVMIGGNFNFQAAFLGEDTVLAPVDNKRKEEFRNDTSINLTAAGSTEDFDYGAVIELNADTSEPKDVPAVNAANSNPIADKTFLYVENDSFGRFEAGANSGVSQTMEVDASNIARGTGGIDGDWRYNLAGIGGFVVTPNLVLAEQDNRNPDHNKITYYTPRFSGFQLGLSYTVDSGNTGTAAGITASNVTGEFENVISAGLGFEGDVADGVGLMASVVGEWGDAEKLVPASTTNDLSAYSAGLGLNFEGFSIAGNIADMGDSGLAAGFGDSKYWTAGAAYENGPYGVSVTYLNGEQGLAAGTNNEATNLVVGADYQMAPGLTPFIEASFFEFENANGTTANEGNVVLVGAQVSF